MKNKINVVIISYACEPNALSEPYLAWETITALARRPDLDITVITRCNNIQSCDVAAKQLGISIRWIGHDCGWFLRKIKTVMKGVSTPLYALAWQYGAARRVRQMHRHEFVDVVHGLSFMTVYNFSAGLSGRPALIGPIGGAQKTPLSITPRIGGLEEALRSGMLACAWLIPRWAYAMRSASRILVANEETAQFIQKEAGVSGEIVHVRQPGFPGRPKPAASSKKATEVASRPIRIFWGSRLLRWKGLEILLRGIADAVRAGHDVQLDVTGWGKDEMFLKDLASKLNIGDRVRFHGRIAFSDLERIRDGADILAFTSVHETTGMALLEMIATGLPVMVLDCGGPREIIRGLPCFPIKPEQASVDIVAAIAAYSRDPMGISESCGKARDIFLERFDWSRYIDELTETYFVLAGRGAQKK